LFPILMGELRSEPSGMVAWFIRDYKELTRRTLRGILSSILFQLANSCKFEEGLLDIFDLALSEAESVVAISEVELWDLLKGVLNQVGPAVIIIDGLDECDSSAVAAEGFRQLTLKADLVKIVILGRSNDKGLYSSLSQHITLNLDITHVSRDILAYVDTRIDPVLELPMVPSDILKLNKRSIVVYLTKNSNGMFLWARLILDHLSCESMFADERTELLENLDFLQGLDSLYSSILDRMSKFLQPDRRLAREAITWVCYSQRRFQLRELVTALALPGKGAHIRRLPSNFRKILLLACGGLIEINYGTV